MIASFNNRCRMNDLLNWTGQNKSSYYYCKSEAKAGRKPTSHTFLTSGEMVSNEVVIESVKKILGVEFVCYGYQKMTPDLRELGYIINPKKVYRLMKESHLLLGKKFVNREKREFVKQRKITASYPMQYLAMDIKYVYIQGERRNVYLLTVIDICTRKVLAHVIKPSIKQHDVVLLLDGVLQEYKVEGITIRNDNGSQFIAKTVRSYLREKHVNQEFTHIATPEENAYIEALHSILEREVIRRYWFDTYHYAKWKIEEYYKFYNSKRRHGSIRKMAPEKYWQIFFSEYLHNLTQAKSGVIVKGEEVRRTCEALDNNGVFATFVGSDKPKLFTTKNQFLS